MSRHLQATIETFPIAGSFTISRGSKTEAEVITCTISENGLSRHGESGCAKTPAIERACMAIQSLRHGE